MDGYEPTTFGVFQAEDYDATSDPGTTDAAVSALADLAGNGRVLELAVGTGRIALPLAARGLDVTGLEISAEMVAKLRDKPGGVELPVVLGDMADVAVEGQFDLVILVFNTLFNLTSQEAQVRCFRNVAARLRPGGRFVIECFVPDLARYRDHQDVRLRSLALDRLALDAVRHDPVTQTLDHQRLHVRDGAVRLVPLAMRYAFPSELDLMAQLAGMRRVERWADWGRAPFTRDSRSHVTVYALPG